MAGDWIKIRKCLPNDPRIVRMASALKADRFRTLGGCLSAWCLFDEHTECGRLDGYTPELLDEVIGFPGLAGGMEAVGWLEVGDSFLLAPRFEKHNGKSAKRRCQESDRKRSARHADGKADRKRTREEKRREERDTSVSLLAPNGASSGSVPVAVTSITWDSSNGFSGITPDHLSRWALAYPAVNLSRAIAAASEWLVVNPAKKKKVPGRFLVNWLARQQERGGDAASVKPMIKLDLGGRKPTAILDINQAAKDRDNTPDDDLLSFDRPKRVNS